MFLLTMDQAEAEIEDEEYLEYLERRVRGQDILHENYQRNATELSRRAEANNQELRNRIAKLEDAIRDYCDVTDLEFEGRESGALRQFVWDDSDTAALKEMEER